MKLFFTFLIFIISYSSCWAQTPTQITLETEMEDYCIPYIDPMPISVLLSNLEIGRKYRVYSGNSLFQEFEASASTESLYWGAYSEYETEFASSFKTEQKRWCTSDWFDFHAKALNDDQVTWTEMNDRDTLLVMNPSSPQSFCTVTSSAPVCSTGTYTFTFNNVPVGEIFSFRNTMYEGTGADILIDIMMDTVNLNTPSFQNQLIVVRYSDCVNCGYMGYSSFPQRIFDVNCRDIVLDSKESAEPASFQFYPTTVSSEVYWQHNVGKTELMITNLIGQEVFRTTLNESTGILNLSGLTPDLYIVRLNFSDGKSLVKRLQKQ